MERPRGRPSTLGSGRELSYLPQAAAARKSRAAREAAMIRPSTCLFYLKIPGLQRRIHANIFVLVEDHRVVPEVQHPRLGERVTRVEEARNPRQLFLGDPVHLHN